MRNMDSSYNIMIEEFWEESYQEYYQTFDFIRRTKIRSRQIETDFGKGASFILNYRCPIIVCKTGKYSLDELAMDLGFESDSAFFEYLMNYESKYESLRRMEREYNDYYGEEE
jgi:hypothetical protein